jgi:mycothiol system anti-sigma-R factor
LNFTAGADTEFTVLQRSSDERVSSPLALGRKAVMLCNDVRRVVYFFLDDSLSASKKSDLEIHLTTCSDCEVRITVQRRLRTFVRARLSRVSAPEHLRSRLTQSLRTVSVSE